MTQKSVQNKTQKSNSEFKQPEDIANYFLLQSHQLSTKSTSMNQSTLNSTMRNSSLPINLQQIQFKANSIERNNVYNNEKQYRNQSVSEDYGYKCRYCSKLFDKLSQRDTHLKVHSIAKAFGCSKPGCERRFKTQGNLNRHEKKCQTEEKEFQCHKCRKEFKYKSSLLIHQRQHDKVYPVKCNHRGCTQKFTNIAARNYHIKKAHVMILKAFQNPNAADSVQEEHKHLDQQNRNQQQKTGKLMCNHKGCYQTFDSIRQAEVHHNRYSKYCAVQKHQLRTKYNKSKAKLKQMRKQNLILKKLLKKHNIDVEREMRKLSKEENQNNTESKQGDEDELEDDEDELSPINNMLNLDHQEPKRNMSGLMKYNQLRQLLKHQRHSSYQKYLKQNEKPI
eukprot:403350586